MKQPILIIDPDCPKPYAGADLKKGAMGGTEATIIRVAEGLAKRGHSVVVAQGARQQPEQGISGLRYLPLNWQELGQQVVNPPSVIMLNSSKLLNKARHLWPATQLLLWMHCFPGKRRRKLLNKWAVYTDATLVAVSNTLADELRQHLGKYSNYGKHKPTGGKLATVTVAYNPVDDQLQPDSTPVDKNKLVFFSSPHKGLGQVLKGFAAVKQRFPEAKLYLANPGYWPMPKKFDEQDVVILGSLKHQEVLQHVREAFCVFYPQSWFRETFGLVFAEANAVGTPVLAHPLGAAQEVLENKQQLLDVTDIQRIADRLEAWYKQGRPQVALPEKFRLQQVLKVWESLLIGKQSLLSKCIPQPEHVHGERAN